MSKRFIESLQEGILAGLLVGVMTFVILLFAGMEMWGSGGWAIAAGGFVLVAYVIMANLPGASL